MLWYHGFRNESVIVADVVAKLHRSGAAANVTTIFAPEVPVSDPVLFDSFQVYLFVPADIDDAVADAARAALDDPPFLDRVRDAVTRLLVGAPALAVLTVVVE